MPFDETRFAHEFRNNMREKYQAVGARCYLCGQPIDYDAPAGSRDALEIDHVIPTSERPELMFEEENLRPAHMSCNRSKQDSKPGPTLGIPSEEW